jgi:hypothetical protein
MYLKKIFYLSVILVLASCSFIKHGKSSASVDEGTILFRSKFLFTDANQVAHFECDDFVSDALNNYTIAKINKEFIGFLDYAKEPVVNKYDPAVTDAIYTYSNAYNKIQIYRAKQNDFIFTFDVTDSRFLLKGNIKPGMTKDDFSRIFHITEIVKNKVQIINSEATSWFMFYFDNNRLKRINSYLYLD